MRGQVAESGISPLRPAVSGGVDKVWGLVRDMWKALVTIPLEQHLIGERCSMRRISSDMVTWAAAFSVALLLLVS